MQTSALIGFLIGPHRTGRPVQAVLGPVSVVIGHPSVAREAQRAFRP